MDNLQLLGELFDKKLITILKFFIVNKGKTFYLKEISDKTKIPIATVFRIIRKLVLLNIIEELKIKAFKLYRIIDSEYVIFLESFLTEARKILDTFVEESSKIPQIDEILLYGQESEEKANILLIGVSINYNQIKKLCGEFKEKYNYNINALSLEREQYNQMTNMGLYSSTKITLYKK